MKLVTSMLLVLLVSACSAHPASKLVTPDPAAPERGTPAWIVEQFFVRKSFPDCANYLFDEMVERVSDPTIGAGLPPGTVVTYRPILLTPDSAVYAVTLRLGDQVEDLYAFLESRGSEWRMGAIRALALPGFVYMLRDSLRAETRIGAQEAATLANMELVTSSDSALRAYFVIHRSALATLTRTFLESRVERVAAYQEQDSEPAAIVERLRAMSLHAIEYDPEHVGCVRVVIGGILDNSVGFFHAPAGCNPPAMSPHDIILLDALEPGWYLYKTT
jgi:hypothetical protein